MSPRMSEKELLDRLADLPREKIPGNDQWPGISAGIERSSARLGASGSGTRWWLQAAAASVVLALAAGLLLQPLLNDEVPSSELLVSSAPDLDSAVEGGFTDPRIPGLHSMVDAEYVAAFREFVNAESSPDTLAAQTVEKIEMGWADLRVTEEALTLALEQNPGDLFLNERMLELRARQLGFLKQIVSLERNNRRLTI
jgi:hypothetical protein